MGWGTAIFLIGLAAILIALSAFNGKDDIAQELPYDLATTLVLVAGFDIVLRQWHGLVSRQLREVTAEYDKGTAQAEAMIRAAEAEEARRGRPMSATEMHELWRAEGYDIE